MKLRSPDGSELMTVNKLSKDGNNLVIDGEIMGSMPVRCVLTPTETRNALKLLNINTFWLLLTMLFRS